MKKFEKITSLLLAGVMVLGLASCGPKQTVESKKPEDSKPPVESTKPGIDPNAVYERDEDDAVYEKVLGDYEELLAAADASSDPNTRYMLYAKAEAHLLDAAVIVPLMSNGGGVNVISRLAPRSIPYVQWGNDTDRLGTLVISNDLVTKEERAELLAQWQAAREGKGTYDPAAYLKSKGHGLWSNYTLTFSTAPATIDWLNTSMASDTEVTVNCVDGLVVYDNLGEMQPSLATSWDISDDGLTYTFHLREGVYWYTSAGDKFAEVTAEDFVAGLRHMLDAQEGLEFLVDGLIVGANDYYDKGGNWDDVGYKAVDKYTLEVTLETPAPYFLTMLTYSCFMPMSKEFYESRGGVFGVEEYKAAVTDGTIAFGNPADVSSNVYCGAFLLQTLNGESEIYLAKNQNYWNKDAITLDWIRFVYNDGSDPVQFYKDVQAGVYAGCNLAAEAIRTLAEQDGSLEKYGYVSDTVSQTLLGGMNMNRGTFGLSSGAMTSSQTEVEKISTHNAMNNQNFRKALMYGFDKETWNAVTTGEALAALRLRNMYTMPNFVSITEDMTDSEGHTFTAGTFYGDMVQYYCDQLGLGIDVHDGVNGWYNVDKAKECLAKAKEELGDSVQWPVKIDIIYYGASTTQEAQAQVLKQVLENALGSENVQVCFLIAETTDDYYVSGYRAGNGEAGNFDYFGGSAWGPDYGDPKTYLDTMKGYGAGYMTKILGLF